MVQQGPQVLAFYKFERDEMKLLILTAKIDAGDILVVELGGSTSFLVEAFHMFGIIGTAVLVAGVSLEIVKRLGLRDAEGVPLGLPPKALGRGIRYIVGGALFGVGWALTGACPGPLVALVGTGVPVMTVAIASALIGTWTYGYLRPRLPH